MGHLLPKLLEVRLIIQKRGSYQCYLDDKELELPAQNPSEMVLSLSIFLSGRDTFILNNAHSELV